MIHHPKTNATTRHILLGLCAWAAGLGWLVGADVAPPLSWNDPLFNANVVSGAVDLADGATITGKSITAVNYAASISCGGSGTISTVRIQSREGVRIAGDGSLVTIDRTFMDITGVGADHADGIQAYSPGGHGSFTVTNSTIKMGTTAVNCGVFVADNYIGRFTFDNVVFWGGLYGLRIHPDVGGDQYVSLKDVYFVGPFAYGEFTFAPVAGHVVHFTKWENVRHATIVNGVLVPGTLIPCPGPVEPGGSTGDTTPPATPAAPTVAGSDPARPVLSGTTEAGATVTIRVDGVAVGSVVADGAGHWTWTPGTSLAPGSHAITVIATDAAGNASAPSPASTVSVPAGSASGDNGKSSGGRCGLGSGLAAMAGLLMTLGLARLRRR